LVVNGSLCDGHGMCALVMPERISLDAWGYASVDGETLDNPRLVARAARVVHACPAGALTLEGVVATPPRRAKDSKTSERT
jgi:ferredoxin